MKKYIIYALLLCTFVFTGCSNKSTQTPEIDSTVTIKENSSPKTTSDILSSPTVSTIEDIDISDSPMRGDTNAPITIIEYLDFQCAFCAQFHKETFPELQKKYIDTKKVRFIIKHFPQYKLHPHATKAAQATECARNQGMFWEMHDKLLTDWTTWQLPTKQNPTSLFQNFAETLKLDQTKFNDCLDNQHTLKRIGEDYFQALNNYSISVTPTFIINGNVHTGFKTFEQMKEIIDAMLKES